MKKFISILLVFIMCASTLTLLSGCGTKGSEGLEYESNGDGTCSVIGMGTCKDENLVIPDESPNGDTVVTIGENAFKNSKIKTLAMANTITEIKDSAFWGNHRLESIEFSNSLKTIGRSAFSECDVITEINLPDSLEKFESHVDTNGEEYGSGSYAFSGCTKLAKVNIPKNLTSLYDDTFEDTAITEVTMNAEFKFAYLDLYATTNDTLVYETALYLEQPTSTKFEPKLIDEEVKALSYSLIFGNEHVKINEESIVVPKGKATPGFYGRKDSDIAYNITSDGKIQVMDWDSTYGKYEINKQYNTGKEETYPFEFKDEVNMYVFTDLDNYTRGFLVYGDYLFFESKDTVYRLNEKYIEN